MSYLDEPEDEYRAADGRSGSRRGDPGRSGRRATKPAQPARPAWDAATYGRPDDARRPVRRSAPEDHGEDRYPSRPPDPPPDDPYGSSGFGMSGYDGSGAYDRPSGDESASSFESPDSYGDSSGYGGSSGYGSGAHGADAYSSSSDPYRDPYQSDAYRSDPLRPEPYESDPLRPEPYQSDPFQSEPYRSDHHPTAAYPAARDSFAPDTFTSYLAPAAPPRPDVEEPPTYVPSGLYLDTDEGGPTGEHAGTYPGGSEDPTPARAKGGRNLPAAIGVGVGLAAVVLGSLFIWRPAFLVVVAVAVGVGTWELVRAVRTTGVNPPLVPLVAGGAVMAGLAWWGQVDGLTFGLIVTVLAAMVWRLADGVSGYGRDVTAATFVAVYVPFLAGFAAILGSPADGHLRVVVTLAAVVLSDTGGYIIGAKLGQHPMAPLVSPKKSWEGLAGSLGVTALGSAVLLFVLLDVSIWWGLLFGLAVSAAAVVGDLAESMIKRDIGVKDMSNLLPGHGGLMDRLDSIVFAAPTAYFMLSFIAPA